MVSDSFLDEYVHSDDEESPKGYADEEDVDESYDEPYQWNEPEAEELQESGEFVDTVKDNETKEEDTHVNTIVRVDYDIYVGNNANNNTVKWYMTLWENNANNYLVPGVE